MIIFVLHSESKPHQDVLNRENIKIEAITEVKGLQGNSNYISCFIVNIFPLRSQLHLLIIGIFNSLFCVFFLSGTKTRLLRDKGADPESAASSHTLQDGDTVSHPDAGSHCISSCSSID